MILSKKDKDEIFTRYDNVNFSHMLSDLAKIPELSSLAMQKGFSQQVLKLLDSSNNPQLNLAKSLTNVIASQLKSIDNSFNIIADLNNTLGKAISQNFIFQQNSLTTALNNVPKMIFPQLNFINNLKQFFDENHLKINEILSSRMYQDSITSKDIFNNLNIDNIVRQIIIARENGIKIQFGHDIILSLNDIKKEVDFNDVISEVEEIIGEQIQKNPTSKVSSSSIQNLIYFLINLLISVYSTQSLESNIISRIDNVGQKLEQEIKNITPANSDKEIFIVKTKLIVREKPDRKSKALDSVYQNNEVEVFKKQADWYYVEYFDYLSGLPKVGWVYGKYLVPKNELK